MSVSGPKTSPDSAARASSLLRTLILAVLLAVAWLLWSGFFKPLLLALGVLSCAITIWIIQRMGYLDRDAFAFRYDWRLLGFWAWLGKEILISSIEVARVVLRREVRVDPRVVKINAEDLDPSDQALLGNSITLTPGTLTLDVHKGRLLVHALTAEGAEGLERGDMQRRVAALSGD